MKPSDLCDRGGTTIYRGDRCKVRRRYACGLVIRAKGRDGFEANKRADAIHDRLHGQEWNEKPEVKE